MGMMTTRATIAAPRQLTTKDSETKSGTDEKTS